MILHTSDGIKVYYKTFGSEKSLPLILVHGLGADRNMFNTQIDKYVAEGFFLIVPDMRGHGDSAKVNSFKIEDCARDLKELLDHLHITNTSLIGVSMGGLIVQQFALDFSSYVDKLIIVDSFSGVSGFFMKFNAKLASLLLKVIPKKLLAKLYGTAYKGKKNEPIRKYFEEITLKGDMKQIRMARSEVNRFDVLKRLKEISVPTLVLVGDLFGKMAINMANVTAEGIPNAQLKVLKGGGDPSNMLVPELFNTEVLLFLKS
ncbi:MAG: alpha/beta fold hydrolase [Candidatus Hermodarchaeota archaeon]